MKTYMININDTIAAISTPPGENGIGIIRVSGPMSLSIADKVFKRKNAKSLLSSPGYSMHYGHVHSRGRIIDEALVCVMRKPHTYTREDIVEINCHSGMACLKEALDVVLDKGARLAQPGEFTKRAFLNKRIDLVQAEAVLDIINSRTKESLSIAQRQLGGESSSAIGSIRRDIIGLAEEFEADINFPEEQLEITEAGTVKKVLSRIHSRLSDILDSSEKGMIFRQGASCVICGVPNTGKSSLMNSLLKKPRAIVAPVPGTTRDTIEESVNIKGILLRMTDTAGIMDSDEAVTKEGVERSLRSIEQADIIIQVLDISRALSDEDAKISDRLKNKKVLVALNKSDLPAMIDMDTVKKYSGDNIILKISAKYGNGIDKLEEAVYQAFFKNKIRLENIILSNSRHIAALKKALDFVKSAITSIDEKKPGELISMDMKDAAESLGVITGEVFTEDMLDAIFNRFCVGK